MGAIRRILVAVKEPEAKATPALTKAAQIARACGARLELFHALTMPIYAETFIYTDRTFEQVTQEARERAQQQLERLAGELQSRGRARKLRMDLVVEWDSPAYEAIVRRATRSAADLVIADLHAGTHLGAALLRLNDWELLRACPAPLLLVKSAKPYDRPVVLAAIDPTHAADKPARLDAGILQAAGNVALALHGQLHALHAFFGVSGGESPLLALDQASAAKVNERLARSAARRCERLLTRAGVPQRRRHIVSLPPAAAIEELANSLHADIVAMGALSRSGLQRLLVGNTAERLLDKLTNDLLIVKPPHFKNKVKRTMSGARFVPAMPVMP